MYPKIMNSQKISILLLTTVLGVSAIGYAQNATGRPTKKPTKPVVTKPDKPVAKPPKPTPSAPTVIFTVLTEPPDSEIIINGNRRGVSNAEGKFVIEKLALGSYTVEVKKAGYHSGSQIFNAGTESPTLVFKLEPALEDVIKEFDAYIAAGNLMGT